MHGNNIVNLFDNHAISPRTLKGDPHLERTVSGLQFSTLTTGYKYAGALYQDLIEDYILVRH